MVVFARMDIRILAMGRNTVFKLMVLAMPVESVASIIALNLFMVFVGFSTFFFK